MAEPIVREFVVDTSKTEQNLENVNKSTQSWAGRLRDLKDQLKNIDPNSDKWNEVAIAYKEAGGSVKFLGEQAAAAGKNIDDLNEPVNNSTDSIEGLKEQLRELTKEFDKVAASDPGGKRYKELAIQIADVKQQITNASEAVQNEGIPAFEGFADNTTSAADKLRNFDVKGFGQQIKASAENIKNFKFGTLTEGLKNTTQGFLQLGKALITNPLFALVGIVTLIVTNIDKLAQAVPLAGIAFKIIGETIGFVKDLIIGFTDAIGITSIAAGEAIDKAIGNKDRVNKELDNQRRLAIAKAKETGQNIDEINKEFQQKRIDDNNALISQINAQEATGVQLTEKQLEERQKLIDENTEFAIAAAEREADAVEKARNEASTTEQKRIDDEAKAAEQARQQAKQKAAQAAAERKAREKEVTDAIKASQEEQFQLTLDAEEKELRQIAIKYNELQEKAKGNKDLQKQLREQELIELQSITDKYFQEQLNIEIDNQEKINQAKIDATKRYYDELAKLQDEQFAETLTNQDKEELAINQKYDNLFALAGDDAAKQKELTEMQQAELIAINKKYNDQQVQNEKEAAAKRKADEFALQDAKLQATSDALNAINGLVGAFAKGDEKRAKTAFKIQKAVSIAQATVDTYKGANAIFANAAANPATILFPAQPFIAAGTAIVAGLANVATIAQQQFQGGGAPSGGGNENPPSLPGDGGGGASQPAQFNPLAASFLQDRPEQLTPRAYVLAGDVASQQEVREKVQDLARIG